MHFNILGINSQLLQVIILYSIKYDLVDRLFAQTSSTNIKQ